MDPGINGTHATRPDGSEVRKFDAPKAVLMSYIIKGILDQKLPWGLVLFGVMMDPATGVFNSLLSFVGIAPVGWLTDPTTALLSVPGATTAYRPVVLMRP